MSKYFVVVEIEVTADSPAEAARLAHADLVGNENTSAYVRVWNEPTTSETGQVKHTSAKYTFSDNPLEVKPLDIGAALNARLEQLAEAIKSHKNTLA